jgi:hypothetical protein
MCVRNVGWKVSDRAEEGHRKVARYIGIEDVKWIVLPRYLCRHLVSSAIDSFSPVVSFRFRCNFLMINYRTCHRPTLTAMESLSDPAGMILSNRKMWPDESLGFFYWLIRHQTETPVHVYKFLWHVRLTCCESFKLVFTVILVLYIGLCAKGFYKSE